jgi:hypothetical protein
MNTTSTPNEVVHMFDHKEDTQMYESKAEQDQLEQSQPIDLVSNHAAMSRPQAIRKFWRLFLMGILVTSAGLYSGYTTSLPGAIVGNKGKFRAGGWRQRPCPCHRVACPVLPADLPRQQRLRQPVCHGHQRKGCPSPGRQLRRPVERNELRVSSRRAIRIAHDRTEVWHPLQPLPLHLVQAGGKSEPRARWAERFEAPDPFSTFPHAQTIITEIFSTTWWHFLLAKLFNGFAAGLIGTSVMSYASEIAMSQTRGTVLSSYAFFFALGQLASAIGLDIINRVSLRCRANSYRKRR